MDYNTIYEFINKIHWFASVKDCFLNFLAERTHLCNGRESSGASLKQEVQTNAAKHEFTNSTQYFRHANRNRVGGGIADTTKLNKIYNALNLDLNTQIRITMN